MRYAAYATHAAHTGYRAVFYVSLYKRSSHDALGGEAEGSEKEEETENQDVSRRFNCGSADHMLVRYPHCHNPQLICLTREMRDFFKGIPVAPFRRIHEAVELKKRKLEWLETFRPGRVVGRELREVLGLEDGDEGEYAPWLPNIAEHGYPAGWISAQDPKVDMCKKVAEQDIGDSENDQWFSILGEADEKATLLLSTRPPMPDNICPDGSSSSSSSTLGSSPSRTPTSTPVALPRRWTYYLETYFSDALLPYAPLPLAPEIDLYESLIEWYDVILGYSHFGSHGVEVPPELLGPPPPLPLDNPPPPPPLLPPIELPSPPLPKASPSLCAVPHLPAQAPILLPPKSLLELARISPDASDEESDMEMSDSGPDG